MPSVDCYFERKALEGPEDTCGDTGYFRISDNKCFAAVVDVLGHGAEAHELAIIIDKFFEDCGDTPLTSILTNMHEHIKGSRGCVAAMCQIDLETGNMTFSGIGNITCRVFGDDHLSLVSRDGIIGYMVSTPREQTIKLHHGDIVMLYSDGIKEHFDIYDVPGLLAGSAKDIVRMVMSSLSKEDDDTSCLVMRYVL